MQNTSLPQAVRSLAIEPEVADPAIVRRNASHFAKRGVRFPLFAELADPQDRLSGRRDQSISFNAPEPGNLFRLHWYNDLSSGGILPAPRYLVLPSQLTGVRAPIAVLLGNGFPMVGSHKVLPAYACLATRLVTGQFDAENDRAVWPSTGNYCRGGVAISRILGCRSAAVLPEGMSAERFHWLESWVSSAEDDIIRTTGSESNVKEIFDACGELERQPGNVVLNQFSEFANYLAHYACTGPAVETLVADLRTSNPSLRFAGFVAGVGSGGTMAAGDFATAAMGGFVAAVEPTECPTLLENGYGVHNIQGIGDKHVPLILNAMNLDYVVGVSSESVDRLDLLFNSDRGTAFLSTRTGANLAELARQGGLGLSGIANVIAAIKLVRRLDLGPNDLVVTVATDSADMYASDRVRQQREIETGGWESRMPEVYGRDLAGIADDDVLELSSTDRRRIFNLGYFTWVEQQGMTVEQFDARRHQEYWTALRSQLPVWDDLITEFNGRIEKA